MFDLDKKNATLQHINIRDEKHGEAATIKMHPECMGAMQDEAAEWGGDFEWTCYALFWRWT